MAVTSGGDLTPSFLTMADALGLGVAYQVLVSPDGVGRRFTALGEQCEAVTGVPPREALKDARALYDLIVPEHRELLRQLEADAISGARRFTVEVQMLRRDGDLRWMRLISAPHRLADGSTVWDGLLTDITEARRARDLQEEQRFLLEAAVEATDLGLWEWKVRTGEIVWSERNRQFFGLSPDEPVDIRRYLQMVHPDDLEGAVAAYQAARDTPEGGDFTIVHRTAPANGEPRWLEVRGRVVRDIDGAKLVVGTTVDITARKAAEDRKSLVMGELAHRLKNGVHVTMAIASQTARSAATVQEFQSVLMARLQSLADAQDLLMAAGGRAVPLKDVVCRALSPFDTTRFIIDDRLAEAVVNDDVAGALALLLHELATNAMKHGALTSPAGQVAVDKADSPEGLAVVLWREQGGPAVGALVRKGFGSRLLEVGLRQCGGAVEAHYDPEGFRARLQFPATPSASPPA